jgi:polar amino acid transport system substrate-binding protein
MRSSTRFLAVPSLAAVLLLAACGGSSGAGGSSTAAGQAAASSGASGSASMSQQLHDKLPQKIKDAGVIVFAGDAHPPYRVVKDGTVTGFDPDLQAALGSVLGVTTRIEVVQGLPAALTGMSAGRYDAFNGPVKDTKAREAQFDNVVYMTSRTAYVFKSGTASDAAGLCGKRVAYVGGSIVEGQLKALSKWCATSHGAADITGVPLADTNATVLAVQSGRAEALGITQAGALDVLRHLPKGAFAYAIQNDEQGAGVDQLALVVPKSSGLGPVILEAFQALFSSGAYTALMEKYGLTDVAVKEPALNVASA